MSLGTVKQVPAIIKNKRIFPVENSAIPKDSKNSFIKFFKLLQLI